ncbi:MAG TPA: hypothetical protein VHB79_30700 [Polyangiaceae bacterium]|nr:hypothetical protein [Polyangiaceae bacterium]
MRRPLVGPLAPTLSLAGLALFSAGCSADDHQESLPLVQVGISCTRSNDGGCTSDVPPIYDDDETQIYEVKKGVQFPILQPGEQARADLQHAAKGIDTAPYGRVPWVKSDDIDVQVTWTISNLDDKEHVVELLVDPWNEFGRYYPGLQLTDAENQEFMPNFSGIDKRYIVGPSSSGDGSRVHGTYAYSDLLEVAVDFSTVMQLIKTPPPAMGDPEDMEDPTVIYTNHAFQWQNRSYNDLLVKPWIPQLIAGLTGLDVGFRIYEPGNIAIEVEVEVVDKQGNRVRKEGEEDKPLLRPSDDVITVGVAPP